MADRIFSRNRLQIPTTTDLRVPVPRQGGSGAPTFRPDSGQRDEIFDLLSDLGLPQGGDGLNGVGWLAGLSDWGLDDSHSLPSPGGQYSTDDPPLPPAPDPPGTTRETAQTGPASEEKPQPDPPDEPDANKTVTEHLIPTGGSRTTTYRFPDRGGGRDWVVERLVFRNGAGRDEPWEVYRDPYPNPEPEHDRITARGLRLGQADPARKGSGGGGSRGPSDGPGMAYPVPSRGAAHARSFAMPKPEDSGYFDPTFDQDGGSRIASAPPIAGRRPDSVVDESGMIGWDTRDSPLTGGGVGINVPWFPRGLGTKR